MTAFISEIFPYAAVALCFIGTAWRFARWLSRPPHVKWTLYPVPEGLGGQLRYMFKEMFTFETLYKFNRRLWAGSFVMHMAMAGFAVCFVFAVAKLLPLFPAKLCLIVMIAAALFIIDLRLTDRSLKVLSNFEEFFNLGFLCIAAAALLPALDINFMTYVAGLATFRKQGTSLSGGQLAAVFLVGSFLIYLPWSKMAHYVSKYFTYHEINWRKQ